MPSPQSFAKSSLVETPGVMPLKAAWSIVRGANGGKLSIVPICRDDCSPFLETDLLSSFASTGSRAAGGTTRGFNVEKAGCFTADGGTSESLITAAPGSGGILIDDCVAGGVGADVTTGPTDRRPPGLKLPVAS